ncbi:MAG: RNA polymerase sigma factor [Mycetocola sp.]
MTPDHSADDDYARDLLKRAAAGDRTAAGLYVAGARASWTRIIRSSVPARLSAEDVISDAIIRLFAQLDAGQPFPSHPRAYVLRTARNLIIDHQRSPRDREDSLSDTTTDLPLSTTDDDRTRQVDLSGEFALVRTALSSLPDKQREILIATTVEGVPPRELTPRFGSSAAAVSTAANRARAALVRALLRTVLTEHLTDESCRAAVDEIVAAEQLGSVAENQHLRDCSACSRAHRRFRALPAALALLAPGAVILGAGSHDPLETTTASDSEPEQGSGSDTDTDTGTDSDSSRSAHTARSHNSGDNSGHTQTSATVPVASLAGTRTAASRTRGAESPLTAAASHAGNATAARTATATNAATATTTGTSSPPAAARRSSRRSSLALLACGVGCGAIALVLALWQGSEVTAGPETPSTARSDTSPTPADPVEPTRPTPTTPAATAATPAVAAPGVAAEPPRYPVAATATGTLIEDGDHRTLDLSIQSASSDSRITAITVALPDGIALGSATNGWSCPEHGGQCTVPQDTAGTTLEIVGDPAPGAQITIAVDTATTTHAVRTTGRILLD